MKRWGVFACKRLPGLLVFLFLLCFARESFAAPTKVKLGLYDGDKTSPTQFTSTAQTVSPWFAETAAKELVHVKLGIKTDKDTLNVQSFQVTITFDKDYFEVTDANGTKVNSITGVSPYFPVATGNPCVDVVNTVDYALGKITYVAWVPAQGLCYASGASALTASSSVPAMVMDFYLKPLKGTNGAEKNIKIDDASESSFVNDTNDVTYSKDDGSLLLESNHGTTGYKFKIRPIPPSLAVPVATNTKVTLNWTGNDTTATKYNVYRGKTTTSGAAEPTSFTKQTTTDLTATTYEDTTISWDGQFTKYWYKVVAKDAPTTGTAVESCTSTPSPPYSQCVTQGVVDTLDPTLQTFDVSSTVFSQVKITATLDEPSFIKAMYSCGACQTPVTNKETAYQPATTPSKSPTVALSTSGDPKLPTTDFVAADEGKTVTYKIKAKDAAGHELAGFSAEKSFTITTCTETSAPPIDLPITAAVSCPDKMDISWKTGGSSSDSTVYYSKDANIPSLKDAFATNANVYKCTDPLNTKDHKVTVNTSCTNKDGTSAASLQTGLTYFYQVCSSNCFGENCSNSSNTFTFNVAMTLTHACPTAPTIKDTAFSLPATTLSGGCSPTATVFYAADQTALKDSPKTLLMDSAGGSSYAADIPGSDVVPPEFYYYIKAEDATQTSVSPPLANTDATKACKVSVVEITSCPTMTLSCNDKTVKVGQDAVVNFTLSGGTADYQCDLYFGTVKTVVTEKLNTKTVTSSYTDTISASKTPEAKDYFFKGECTDACTPTAVKATSSVCTLTVQTETVTTATVKGTVKASDTSLPLEGATVKLKNASSDNDVASTTTGADGTFSFAGITATTGSPAYRIVVTASGYSTSTLNVNTVSAPETNVGEIILAKTTKIAGKCTNSKTGAPISGLIVKITSTITGQSFAVQTNTLGEYSQEDLQAGTYSVEVDVKGTAYRTPDKQTVTVPPDGLADFSLDPSPVVTVTIKPSSKFMGFNEKTSFELEDVLTASGAALPKTPVEWDISNLTSLGTISYSDGNKTILLFTSGTKEGSAVITVTKVAGEDVPAGAVSTALLTVTKTLAVKEIKLLMPVIGGKITDDIPMKKPISKDVGYVIIQSEVTLSNVSVLYKIYNMQGRLMKILSADPQTLEARWDCMDESNARVPNGIYIIQAEASGGGQTAHPVKPKAVGCLW